MPFPTRRQTLGTLLALAATGPTGADAQAPPVSAFRMDDVIRRARDLAAAPFDAQVPALPEPIANLGFEAYQEIRFRPDRAFLAQSGTPFRIQLFHLGLRHRRPVIVNMVRDGVPSPIPYQPQLFDYGRTKIERPLPVNLGFAGLRVHYPLNNPRILDELVAFLGGSAYRLLGREQRYGLTARGLTVAGQDEPFFREFWIDAPQSGQDKLTLFALLDGPATTGAFRFDVYPAQETEIEVTVALFPRRPLAAIGIAPLSSMFFSGENERRSTEDFRPERHDSDGLLVHAGSGEWIWRPLRNPDAPVTSGFQDKEPRGFGLMQRDRAFESYQDLDAFYQQRPSYWIETVGSWGEGRIELVEQPSPTRVVDNVTAQWIPARPIEPGQDFAFAYRIKALTDGASLHPGGRALNSFVAPLPAEPIDRANRRFRVDFGGGNLAYWLQDPGQIQIVASAPNAKILATWLLPNEHVGGFRAFLDVRIEPGQSSDLRLFLRAGEKVLTETWTYPWTTPA